MNNISISITNSLLPIQESDIEFFYNPLAKKSTNVMDKWILACSQSLIKFVREEMEGKKSP